MKIFGLNAREDAHLVRDNESFTYLLLCLVAWLVGSHVAASKQEWMDS